MQEFYLFQKHNHYTFITCSEHSTTHKNNKVTRLIWITDEQIKYHTSAFIISSKNTNQDGDNKSSYQVLIRYNNSIPLEKHNTFITCSENSTAHIKKQGNQIYQQVPFTYHKGFSQFTR